MQEPILRNEIDNATNLPEPISDQNDLIQNVDEDILSVIAAYYLTEKKQYSSKITIGKNFTLFVVSATSMWLFYSTSGLVADNNQSLKIKLIAGGMGINFLVTWNTSQAFLEYILSKQIPKELIKYADMQQIRRDKISLIFIAAGAFINAIPISLAVFIKTTKLTPYLIAEAIVTQIDNTFIHTFPTLIVAGNTILRNIFLSPLLPIIGLIYGLKWIKESCCLSDRESNNLIELRLKSQNHLKLKNAVITTLERARANIAKESFKFVWYDKNRLFKFGFFCFYIEFPYDLLPNNNPEALAYLIKIAARGAHGNNGSNNRFRYSKFILNTLIGGIFYILGTMLINIAILGFYKNTYDNISWVSNKNIKLSISLYPNMLLSVLVSYFAARFFRNIIYDGFIVSPIKFIGQSYQYCISRKPITVDPLPTSSKYYFKLTLLFIGASIYLALYSYGTALSLLQEHFTAAFWKRLMPYLTICTIYGMFVFNYKNAIEFILDKAAKAALYLDSDNKKSLKTLDDNIVELENFITHMNGDILEASFKERTVQERQMLLNLNEDEFIQLCDHKPKASPVRNYWPFWQNRSDDEEQKPLLAKIDSDDSNEFRVKP